MTDALHFPRRSGLSRDELQRIADELQRNLPRMFEVLSDPESADKEEYEGMTSGLFNYLGTNEERVKGQHYGPISKLHLDLVNFLAARLEFLVSVESK